MPKKFWIVLTWGNDFKGGIQRWPTYKEAVKCADKVAKRLPHIKVYVLQAMDYRWIPREPSLETHILERAKR